MAKVYKIISAVLFAALMVIMPFRRSVPFDPYVIILALFILAVGFLWLALDKDAKNGIERKVVILGLDWDIVGFWFAVILLISGVRSGLGDLPLLSVGSCLSFCKVMIWDKNENKAIPYQFKKDQLLAIKIIRVAILVYAVVSLISLAQMPVAF